jgi:hypothetical protein
MKLRITETAYFETIRLFKLMPNDNKLICPKIGPDERGAEGTISADVSKVTATAPEVDCPIRKPSTVRVKADAGISAPAVVTTKEFKEQGLHCAVKPKTLLDPTGTVGVTDIAKKPIGYLIVIVPPGGTTLNGVKPMVRFTGDLSAMRSEVKIANDPEVTKESTPKMKPDSTGTEGSISAEVETVQATLPAVT